MSKLKQRRPCSRAPHGAPESNEKLAAWGMCKQKRAFQRNGGSAWLQKILDAAISAQRIKA